MAYEPFSKLNHTSENKLSRIVGRGVVRIRHRCAGTCSAGPGLHELGKTCMTPLGHLYVNSGAHWARRCALQSGSQKSINCIAFPSKTIVSWLKNRRAPQQRTLFCNRFGDIHLGHVDFPPGTRPRGQSRFTTFKRSREKLRANSCRIYVSISVCLCSFAFLLMPEASNAAWLKSGGDCFERPAQTKPYLPRCMHACMQPACMQFPRFGR